MEKTLKELIAEKKIKMSCEYGGIVNEEFKNSDPWTCLIRYGNRRMTVPFYMGYGHNGREPKIEDVLDCLLSDANSGNATTLEEFCRDLGYDPDSRRAERIYKACMASGRKLRQLLGEDFDSFMYAERN